MDVVFLTGFPGFVGSELVPRLLGRGRSGARDADSERGGPGQVICLVEPRYVERAREELQRHRETRPEIEARVHLVQGDITRPHLGLSASRLPLERVTEVHHLAAVYDLALEREVGLRVNVEGTRNVLRFAEACPALERFHYVSTCYVSGRHQGLYTEDDLDVGQTFNNAYEETKYRAELLVQERMREGLPATVYRPAIVVGDSRTGRTGKYDGPYFMIRWLLRWRRLAPVPVPADGGTAELNMVPVDFVTAAISHLSSLPGSAGKVYHLADPAPATLSRIVEILGEATGRRPVRIPGSARLAGALLRRASWLESSVGIPAQLFDYLDHPTRYGTDRTTRDLAGSGIEVPPFSSYADRLVAFVRAHPELGEGGRRSSDG